VINKNYMPQTELRNEASSKIDEVSTVEMLNIINDEDKKVAYAVEKEICFISQAVEAAELAIRNGGRVIYMGCGTSGRLGVLDASECPPTYSVPQSMFTGVIAGGFDALIKSSEGMEDHEDCGVADLKEIKFSEKDFLIGIAASGRTPYVVGGLKYAASVAAKTACIVCSKDSPMAKVSDIVIAVETGPEVVTGSTRMKAGTAQKMVLNMISTGAMIKLGKVYENLMVDVRPSNSKLIARAQRIISEATGCTTEQAEKALKESGNRVKIAICMIIYKIGLSEAEKKLTENGGVLKGVMN